MDSWILQKKTFFLIVFLFTWEQKKFYRIILSTLNDCIFKFNKYRVINDTRIKR